MKEFSIQEQILHRNVQRFRGGIISKAYRPLYHSTRGLGVMKKKKEKNQTLYVVPFSPGSGYNSEGVESVQTGE